LNFALAKSTPRAFEVLICKTLSLGEAELYGEVSP